MPRNGSGGFVRVHDWTDDADAAIKIRADRMDEEDDGFAQALTDSIAKDGQTTPTANLPMGGYRHTGVGAATARTQYVDVAGLQDGSYLWVDGGGTADAITATYSPALTTLVDGQFCLVRATAANATTTPTFAPNGVTARTITKFGGAALLPGDIAGDGHQLILRYDLANTRWELLNPALPSALEQMRNRLINASFALDLLNLGASTSIADDSYCFDRWYVLTQTAAVNVSQITEPEDGYPYAIRLTQNQSSAQRMGIAQIIKGANCKDLRGQSGTLSGRVRISNSQAVRYAILGWTGTENSVTSDVVNSWTSGTYTAGNFFLASNVSVLGVGTVTPSANTWTNLTALTASLGSSFENIIIMAWTEGTAAQNVTLDFEYLQFERGIFARPLERVSDETERSRCQAHLRVYGGSTSDFISPAQAFGTTSANLFVQLSPPMYDVPTFTNLGAATDFSMLTATGGQATLSALSLAGATRNMARLSATVASGLASGNSSAMIPLSAAGRFALRAEL